MTRDALPAPERLHLELGSSFENLERTVEAVQEFMEHLQVEDDLAYRVVLLTSEAVTNAIEHGNRNDPEKLVVVDVRVRQEAIEVQVEDEGEGFDPDELVNPLKDENLLQDSGRGLFLMEQLADEVHVEQGGRRLRMLFYRSG